MIKFHESVSRAVRASKSSLHEVIAILLGGPIKTEAHEADSGSAFPAVTAPGVKGCKESNITVIGHNFREAVAPKEVEGGKFRVVLIEEGLGNFGDAFYYSKEALDSAAKVFEGLKIMADHPTAEEEEIRPERSTRDVLGHYENLEVVEGEGGQHQLMGDLITLPGSSFDWARSIMVRAVENSEKFPDKPFIGLSINAAGDAEEMSIEEVMKMAPQGAMAKLEEAEENGIESVRVVHRINRAKSCDLVTEAGAGGKISNILEGVKNGHKKK